MKNNVLVKKSLPVTLYIILAFGILLRLPNLNESLWFDELYSTKIWLGNIGRLLFLILHDFHPPFYSIFMFFWIRVFGDSEISIRILPFLFGILSIFLTYLIALKYTEKKTALLTSYLLCVSPVHIWYSQEARNATTVLLFLLISVLSFSKLREPKINPIWYPIYFVSLFLAVFTHYCAVVFLLIFSIISLIKINKVKRNILTLNCLILICLISFLGLEVVLGTFTYLGQYLRPFTIFELWMLFFNWFLFGNSLWNIFPYGANLDTILKKPFMLYAQIFFLIIFLRGLILNFKRSKDSYGLETIAYLFTPPLIFLILTYIGFKHIYIERSLFIVLPFFYLVLARGITGFKTKSIRIVCISLLIVFNVATFITYINRNKDGERTVHHPNPEWRLAARYFDSETKNTQGSFFIFATAPATPLIYYDSRFSEEPLEKKGIRQIYYPKEDNDTGEIYRILSRNGIKIFYLIRDKHWGAELLDSLLDKIKDDSRFHFLGTQSFKVLKIYKFEVI